MQTIVVVNLLNEGIFGALNIGTGWIVTISQIKQLQGCVTFWFYFSVTGRSSPEE